MSGFMAHNCVSDPIDIDANIDFQMEIKTIVRSTTASQMLIDFSDVSTANADVLDWKGSSLEKSPAEGPENTQRIKFALHGPGVYEVRLSGTRNLSTTRVSGAVSEKGSFSVFVQ